MMSTGMSSLNLTNWQIPVFLCIVGALILFSLIINVCVVYIINHSPSLTMPPYSYIMYLSIGDIIQSLIVMPVTAYFNLVGVNSAGCKFWMAIMMFKAVMTVFSHVAIVVDRYFAITCTIPYHTEIRCFNVVLFFFFFFFYACIL
jgi:hypothetical protein